MWGTLNYIYKSILNWIQSIFKWGEFWTTFHKEKGFTLTDDGVCTKTCICRSLCKKCFPVSFYAEQKLRTLDNSMSSGHLFCSVSAVHSNQVSPWQKLEPSKFHLCLYFFSFLFHKMKPHLTALFFSVWLIHIPTLCPLCSLFIILFYLYYSLSKVQLHFPYSIIKTASPCRSSLLLSAWDQGPAFHRKVLFSMNTQYY